MGSSNLKKKTAIKKLPASLEPPAKKKQRVQNPEAHAAAAVVKPSKRSAAGQALAKVKQPAKKKQARPEEQPVAVADEDEEDLDEDDESEDDDDAGMDDDDEDGDQESIEDEETQVEFTFHDPAESDFHVVKGLLLRYLDGRDFDSSACADAIIDQAQVATCLRTGEDCVGIAAVLPLSEFGAAPFAKQALKHWAAKADAASRPRLAAAAAAGAPTALLLSERVMNAPPEVAAPLAASVARELEQCRQNADEEDLAPYARVKQFLACAKAYVDGGERPDEAGAIRVSASASASAAGCKARSSALVCERYANLGASRACYVLVDPLRDVPGSLAAAEL